MKTVAEMVEALRHKLQVFGIRIDGPARIFCGNEAAHKRTSIHESALSKKYPSIA